MWLCSFYSLKLSNMSIREKRKFTFICILLCLCCQVRIFAVDSIKRPKIGLVLSGGGAKGFAHIGLLALLDSLEIPIDYIAGTSMGGILGGLYAIGYRGQELKEMALETDWLELFTDKPSRSSLPYIEKKETGRYQLRVGILGMKPSIPSGMIYGQKISLLFASKTFAYEQFRNFDELPIPFRCIAADLLTGNEVILQSGSLSKALRATMSIPTLFSPVEWGDSLLIDGGVVNNLPVDVVKSMGADIVIAVDVMGHQIPREHLTTALDILERSTHLMSIDRWRKNIELADLVIYPDLTDYTLGDFSSAKILKIIREGEIAANHEKENLIKLKEIYQLEKVSNPNILPMMAKFPVLEDVQLIGPASAPFEQIYDQLDLQTGVPFHYQDFNQRIRELKQNDFFHQIEYEIIPISDKAVRLLIRVEEQKRPVIYRVTISGQKNLSFGLIYRLLDIKPGDILDLAEINRKIMNLYGLDYFERIEYEIFPIKDQLLHLNIVVKELPMRQLRISFRYDNYYKMVGAVGLKINSFLIPGLRLDNEFQFAGLKQFWNRLIYPAMGRNLPVYPFFRQSFKDIPTTLFDGHGNPSIQYQDNSNTWAAGFGWTFGNKLNFEAEARTEQVWIRTNFSMISNQFFCCESRLNQISLNLHWDSLNDPLLPSRGLSARTECELSLRSWHTDVSYQRQSIQLDYYQPVHFQHVIRIYSFYGWGSSNMPVYKYFNQGRPEFFIGMDYDQLIERSYFLCRSEYQYYPRSNIAVVLAINQVPKLKYSGSSIHYSIWGCGVGLKVRLHIGLFGLFYGLGSQDLKVPDKTKSHLYMCLGARF
jgi:predicted acylesterase/phospholipase RssA